MELRHLRYFVTVADERNFTRAAEKLFIAQPPLSRQVRQLEEELGVALFVPGARPLTLTEAGEFLYAHATQMLAKANDVKTMTRRIGHIQETLRVGYVASTLYGFLPEIIRKFKEEAPEVSVSWHEMNSIQQLEALKAGKIDVGFGRLRIEDAAIRRILLREEKLMAALPNGHVLTQKHSQIALVDLVEDTLVVYPAQPRPSFADQVLSISPTTHSNPPIFLKCANCKLRWAWWRRAKACRLCRPAFTACAATMCNTWRCRKIWCRPSS